MIMVHSFVCVNLRPKAPALRRHVAPFSCNIKSKQIVHIQGNNGSGKTTLLKCMLHFHAASGSCTLYDVHNKVLNKKYYCDYLPAQCTLPNNSSVATYLQHNALIQQPDLKHWPLDLTHLPIYPLHHKPCNQLSSGEKKLCLISQLILNQKKIWLLDEPFNHLDKYGQKQLMQAIERQIQQGGLVILTHHGQLPKSQNTPILTQTIDPL
jgi:heme exporter protein A